MVLNELGAALSSAFARLARAPATADDALLGGVLRDVSAALLAADVNVKLVKRLSDFVKGELLKLGDLTAVNRARVVERAVVGELTRMLDPGVVPFKPHKKRPNVVVFVGLQGAGKTTTVAKYAHYYQARKWKVAMVGADTFRAGAFDQLKQNATKVRVPFYGSYTEADAAKIAAEGVDNFRREGYELIIVDTSGRHKQEAGLFDEMRAIMAAISPDHVVFVMDGSIGQAAAAQAEAFKAASAIGSVIITKLDGHARGGGALSAVAATGAPIVFIGTGEGFDDLAPFDAARFIGKLLGKGDMGALLDSMKEKGLEKMTDELMDKVDGGGKFSFRDMIDQFAALGGLTGGLGAVYDMMPQNVVSAIAGGSGGAGGKLDTDRFKKFKIIADSMTKAELDCDVELSPPRAARIISGSGVHPQELESFVGTRVQMDKMMSGFASSPVLKNEKELAKQMKSNPAYVKAQLVKSVDPKLLEQMGGIDVFMTMFAEPAESSEQAAKKKQNKKR